MLVTTKINTNDGPTSLGDPIVIKGVAVSGLLITNNTGESIQYSTNSGGSFTTLASGSSASLGSGVPSLFRFRRVNSGSYPLAIDATYTDIESLDAQFGFDSNGNTVLVGADGNIPVGVGVSVAPATGDAAVDTANVNAAYAAAGANGVVSFPVKNVYIIKNYVGGVTNIPRKIFGNGSTLKADTQTFTNLAAGQSIATGGRQTFTVADGAQLAGASFIVASTGAGAYSQPMTVSSLVGNSVTVSGASVVGILSGTGVTVTPICNLMLLQLDGTTTDIEITGLTFDGNLTNRTRNRQWSNDELLKIINTSGTAKIWIHHNVFKDASCEGISASNCSFLSITDNHFENINGSGVHPGGSGSHVDYTCARNTFKNVYQLTAATSPTVTNYGHNTSYGAICTSSGPGRAVVSDNIIDTSTGYGIYAINNSDTFDFSITGNVIYNCTHGGWRCASTGDGFTITGNMVRNCGHDTLDISNNTVETTAISGTAKKGTITGNTLIDSQLWLGIDAGDLVVSGNYFSALGKQYGANSREIASLNLAYSSSENANISVSGNVFRGPKNSTESTAISNLPWNGIQLSRSSGVVVAANTITGYRHGINFGSSIYKGVGLNNNAFFDQFNSGGQNAHAILGGAATTAQGITVIGNTMTLSASGTGAWVGIEFGTVSTSCINNMISGNTISAPTINTGNTGIQMNGNTTGWAITNNSVYLGYGASAIGAIVAASAGTGMVITNNVIRNSSPVNYGSATVAAGNVSI